MAHNSNQPHSKSESTNGSGPIGIFDSGIGGLIQTKALVERLPNESIIYFGDTAHLPYGDKSAATIRGYVIKIAEMLLARQCKLILIACNTICAAAYDVLQEYIGDRALLVNVIDPLVNYLHENYANKTVGLIATRQTVTSQIYRQKIDALHANITLKSLATPLLVPAIEEGFATHKLIDHILHEYLSREELQQLDALILGCTHYPLIKKNIADFYNSHTLTSSVELIDSSPIVAAEIEKQLAQHQLLRDPSHKGDRQFYISEYTEAFNTSAKLFFGTNTNLTCYRLDD
jgi:glutamate racemase